MKYDASGNVLWAKSAGGTSYDEAGGVSVDANDDVLVTGYFFSATITFGATTLTNADNSGGTADIFIVKYDGSGNLLWAKRAGGGIYLGYYYSEVAFSVSTDPSNNILVTGNFQSFTINFGSTTITNADNTSSTTDMFIVQYDASGNVLWAKSAGINNYNEFGIDVSTDASSHVLLLGYFMGNSITFGTTTLTNIDNTGSTADFFVAKINPSALPIELVNFTAVSVNNQTVLTEWKTASEVNSDYFTIERSKEGKDDGNWEYVGNVDGAGNSSTTLNYELEDKTPYKGTSYYRLKQTDFNGDFEYFGPVAVRLEGVDIINLYPNPATDHIDYSVASSLESNITITLVDVLGRKVMSETSNLQIGKNKLRLDISNYSQGMYMIQLKTELGNYRTQKQFIVK